MSHMRKELPSSGSVFVELSEKGNMGGICCLLKAFPKALDQCLWLRPLCQKPKRNLTDFIISVKQSDPRLIVFLKFSIPISLTRFLWPFGHWLAVKALPFKGHFEATSESNLPHCAYQFVASCRPSWSLRNSTFFQHQTQLICFNMDKFDFGSFDEYSPSRDSETSYGLEESNSSAAYYDQIQFGANYNANFSQVKSLSFQSQNIVTSQMNS